MGSLVVVLVLPHAVCHSSPVYPEYPHWLYYAIVQHLEPFTGNSGLFSVTQHIHVYFT